MTSSKEEAGTSGSVDKDEDVVKNSILRGVNEISSKIEDLLKYAKECIQESTEDFIKEKIRKLFSLTTVYKDCFKRLNINNREDLDRLFKHYFRHQEIQDAVQEFEDLEDEWNILLKDIDRQIQRGDEISVTVNEEGPVMIPLSDARTGEEDDIASANGLVIVISFGERKGAEKWIEDTGCKFPVLLDTERKVYQTFGLHRSVYKVWNIPSIVYYAEQMALGRILPKPYENVHDDPHQMGGDFIMDKTGQVRYMYCSKIATDRPSVETVIQEIKKIK